MKSHRWIDTHVGKFLACSATEESSDNDFIYTILLPPPKSSDDILGSPWGVEQWRGDLCLLECFYFNLRLFQSGDWKEVSLYPTGDEEEVAF